MIDIAPEVTEALDRNRAVVALESTVIAHGLPRPTNFETAQHLEHIVRGGGGAPATIGILCGRVKVGLTTEEVRKLAEEDNIRKVSTRDLPIALAERWDGATTVATTCWIAHRAGIKVFATGGIGGVHRGALPDVSADLPELSRTPIIVVCSGAKIVLDLPATREWLETYGVTVIGYGCDDFPAFYSRSSGLPVDTRVDTPSEVARLFRMHTELRMSSALLVTVPVPEEFEVPQGQLQTALAHALESAERNGISGRDLTPFLLSQMAEHSRGATLRANIALLENNARVAAEIAVALRSEI
ncbi:MAG TPA: pseudouridine-5'-phosphate glycosidase [Pyrinomonadaceae bacterium]|nr:pseudouridine-5'-phosphate glycosidase [Pyrinomonadaceae bacterium]